MWQCAKNEQQCRDFHNAIQSSDTNTHPSIWKLIPLLMKEEILVKKEKVLCWMGRQVNKKKKKLYNTMNEYKCLGIIHKMKPVICTVLLWIYTHFKCTQIFCILHILILLFIFHVSFYSFSFIFCYFIFYSKIALWPISYAAKMLPQRCLWQRCLWQKYQTQYWVWQYYKIAEQVVEFCLHNLDGYFLNVLIEMASYYHYRRSQGSE